MHAEASEYARDAIDDPPTTIATVETRLRNLRSAKTLTEAIKGIDRVIRDIERTRDMMTDELQMEYGA